MRRKRSDFQKSVGKLISSIQKEWGRKTGTPDSEIYEEVMYSAHDLLQAGSPEKARNFLGTMTVRQYLGSSWVLTHPDVESAILVIEKYLFLDARAMADEACRC